MIPVSFRKKISGGQPTQEQLVAIFWPGDTSPEDFFGNQLMIRRAEGLKLLTEANFGTLLNSTLEFLQHLKSFNSGTIKEGSPDDLLACKILDARTKLRDLRKFYRANLILSERTFETDNGENADKPSFYTFKNARTRLQLSGDRVIRLSNNILTKLPSGEHTLEQCRQALGFEIQGEKLVAILDDQSKVEVTRTNNLCFILDRPFLATGELALNFIKALTKALYISEVFPDLKYRFLVNVEGVLLNVKDFISVFDVTALSQMLGVNLDSPSGLSEAINLQEPKTSNNVVPEDAGVVRRVKISLDRAQSIYAAVDLDSVSKQWVAAVSYLILYLRVAQKYLVGCEIEISSGNYYIRLPPSRPADIRAR